VYEQPIILGGQAIHLSISLGCAYYPEFTHIVNLQDADQLMYQGKSEGKNRAVFQVITDSQVQPELRQVP
jgi:GGDEF domain-containing protein